MSRWAAGSQRVRDGAIVLPVAATLLLLPPFILIFAAPVFVGGIPLIVLYVFGIWAGVIACAWLVARRLAPVGPAGASAQPESGDEAPRRESD